MKPDLQIADQFHFDLAWTPAHTVSISSFFSTYFSILLASGLIDITIALLKHLVTSLSTWGIPVRKTRTLGISRMISLGEKRISGSS
ncbi:hypothetical protein L873DRAFT_1805474 [Choiromyces venosus 120613-1]|uniref:Uncharacterized protein n=1 Tax=Choiromyces venosus 120613-1 TaxID=1336337 RepID=A0A3N4JPY1_9PEZI|nr:hypothetical protein L873DRAFT_1805474 [Choiromyces venosus 120613-1]